MSRAHRPRRLAALTAIGALTLAACGGEDDAAPAAAPETDTMADTMTDDMADTMTDDMADTMTDAETMTDDMADTMTDAETMADTMADTMTDDMADTMTDAETMTDDMADTMTDDMADLPAYQTLGITDVDGATFTLHELAGTPVFVEAFATWCPSCRSQLERTNEAAAQLGDSAVVLALSVETDLSSSAVAEYAADNGFDNIRFAVMTPELLAALVDEFGGSVANPPSTPWFLLDPMGSAGDLMTGGESADEIVAAVQALA
jgi:thiol-disulfide isomerase/thioredoxin